MRDSQLRWVHRNGGRSDGRCQAVGVLARAAVQSPVIKGPAWRRRLLAVIAEGAGTELLEQVEVASTRNGVLALYVADPALLYQLRLQWEQRLLELLGARLPEAGIRVIRFTSREPA